MIDVSKVKSRLVFLVMSLSTAIPAIGIAETDYWHPPAFPESAKQTAVDLLKEVFFKYGLSCGKCDVKYTDGGVQISLPNNEHLSLTYKEILTIGEELVEEGYYDKIIALDNAGLYGESEKSALLLREIIIRILTEAHRVLYLRQISLRGK